MMKNNNSGSGTNLSEKTPASTHAEGYILSAVVAMGQNNSIGLNNHMPWHMPADLRHFKALTTGHPIIMGRKTHEAIGKPLPNRVNIVVTQQTSYEAPGCLLANSLDEAIKTAQHNLAPDTFEIFIIGGAILYEQALPLLDRIYLTLIHHDFEADTFFPKLPDEEWQTVSEERHAGDQQNPYAYSFIILERGSLLNTFGT